MTKRSPKRNSSKNIDVLENHKFTREISQVPDFIEITKFIDMIINHGKGTRNRL